MKFTCLSFLLIQYSGVLGNKNIIPMKMVAKMNCILTCCTQFKWLPNRNEQITPKFFIISQIAFNAPRTLNSIYWNVIGRFYWFSNATRAITYQSTIHWLVREEQQLMRQKSFRSILVTRISNRHLSPKLLEMDLSAMENTFTAYFCDGNWKRKVKNEEFTIIGMPNKWIVRFAPIAWDMGNVK